MNASSDNEGNIDEDAPETPYDGENIDAYSNNEENNYKVPPNPQIDNENINYDYDDEKNDYEVTHDTPTNGGNNETIEMTKKK